MSIYTRSLPKATRRKYRRRARRDVGREALRQVRQIRSGMEEKEKTGSTACTTALDDTWSDIPILFGIAQGQTAETRDGKKIRVRNIACKFKLAIDAAETTNSATRVVIFIDKRPNHTQVTEDEPFSTTTIMALYETADKANKGRFKFIYDKTFHWGGKTAAGERPIQMIKKFYYNKPFDMLHTGAGALIANIDMNAVYMCAVSSNASHTGTVTAQWKVKFVDY